MRIALVLSLLLAVLAVVFALQNPAYIMVSIGPFDINQSTALILMITFCLGVIVGILATVPTLVKRRRKIRRLERQKAALPPPDTTTTMESPIDTSTTQEQRTP